MDAHPTVVAGRAGAVVVGALKYGKMKSLLLCVSAVTAHTNGDRGKVFGIKHGLALCNIVKGHPVLDAAKESSLWAVDAKLTDVGVQECLKEPINMPDL